MVEEDPSLPPLDVKLFSSSWLRIQLQQSPLGVLSVAQDTGSFLFILRQIRY